MDDSVERGGRLSRYSPVEYFERAERSGHPGTVIWLTGLSAAGKSTIAMFTERALFRQGYQVCRIDGDVFRRGVSGDLGFSATDRQENIRRAGEVTALFADTGFVVLAAFISPFAGDRALARRASRQNFHEVYVRADLDTCERRDPRGLYRRARLGEIVEFTGVSSPYEPPTVPDLVIDTATLDVDDSVAALVRYVTEYAAPQVRSVL